MDAATLDGLLREIAPLVNGRLVERVRLAGSHALLLELRRATLWLDVARGTAGAYLLDRPDTERLRALATGAPDARARQALLHLRKHVEGRRLDGLQRVAGERVVTWRAGSDHLVLRLAQTSVVTLAVGGDALCGLGGEPVWPPPPAQPARGWQALTPETVARIVAEQPERAVGALLAACPELGPALARRLARAPASWTALRAALASPRPTVLLPGPLARSDDADLAMSGAVQLLPFAADAAGPVVHPPTWSAAAALFLEASLRGARFEFLRRTPLAAVRVQAKRLLQLEHHLAGDLEGLPDEESLRRSAEALLAFGAASPAAAEIELPDPYQPERLLRVRLDPRLSVPANADRLFEKARRATRARVQVAARLAQTRAALAEAHRREERLRTARNASDLPDEAAPALPARAQSGPRRFLTSRGLTMLVGRGARENHELTFKTARPEDYWLHAREAPGAHVILRDPEGRAAADDVREAAEVAAFFSQAAQQPQVDVHATRRKHVQPTGGAPGRVRVAHSETLRVTPRDPVGRLRAR